MHEFLNKFGIVRRLRDPIYGYIPLTRDEQAIIDTPLFQRLRRIHQLALTKYVYPMAENSRFVHSVGAMHCATALYSGAIKNRQYEDEDHCIHLRLAALLHDVGHLPFSHAVESQLLKPEGIVNPQVKVKHEQVGQYLIEHHPVLSDLLEGRTKKVVRILSKEEQRPRERILSEFISGQLDADRADYLLRDSHSCGVQYGIYDFERYKSAFTVHRENGKKYLEVRERDIFVVESFLLARYHYNLQVPYHRTRTGFDLVLKRYIRDAKERGLLPNLLKYDDDGSIKSIDFKKFEDFDDYQIFGWIKKDYRDNNPYAEILLRLKHLVPIFDVSSCHFDKPRDGKLRLEALRTALKEKGFVENDDFFVYEGNIALSKFTRVSDEGMPNGQPVSDPSSIQVLCKDGSRRDISRFSLVVKNMSGSLRLYRLYAMPDKAKAIAEIGKHLDIPGVVTPDEQGEG